jgi:predicted flap endonuclease-1-like 5' DNA nuclease
MGAALREAWLWVLLAFLLGLTIGYFVRQQPVRVRASTSGTSAGTPTTSRIPAHEARREDLVGDQGPAESIPATAKAADASPVARAVSAPATVVAPVEPATTAPATKRSPRKRATGNERPGNERPGKPSAQTAALDLAAAKATLGVTVRLDDLKLIEGIGPKIETLFKADGITSWHELSKANVERLQGVLDAAGPRYKVPDPASWPRQAGLLAKGKWTDFKALTDKLKDGR